MHGLLIYGVIFMRYHTVAPDISARVFGKIHVCDHPVYSRCTLYFDGVKGLAIIQQRYDNSTKHTWWTEADPWIANAIFLHSRFTELFDRWAESAKNGIFPTLSIRQAMWYLRIKPIKREPWETVFDYKPV